MMRAAVLYDQAFVIETRPVPVPGPGEVLLKTRLCGICGSDLHLFKHAAEIAKLGAELGAPAQDMTKGLVLGHEYVAEVVGFGTDTAQALAIGDRVVSVPFLIRDGAPMPIGAHVDVAGAYGQFFLGSEMLLLKVPDGVPDAAAALVEPLAIAVHAVAKSPLNGDSHAIVVQGCGPIGLAVAAVLLTMTNTTLGSIALASAIILVTRPALVTPTHTGQPGLTHSITTVLPEKSLNCIVFPLTSVMLKFGTCSPIFTRFSLVSVASAALSCFLSFLVSSAMANVAAPNNRAQPVSNAVRRECFMK